MAVRLPLTANGFYAVTVPEGFDLTPYIMEETPDDAEDADDEDFEEDGEFEDDSEEDEEFEDGDFSDGEEFEEIQ